ncbi:MAG: substrate-binding domain-containing protein, partial [Oscillospiraceae bacterium]|nr:substrate-binding domain-containing protein [Oscillospiraceae bacterium]
MLNGRKTIGIFMSGIAGTFRRDLCHELYRAGTGHGFDLLFFNFVGTIGADYIDYGVREDRILDVIPFDKFDGMIFDNNNVFIDSVRDHIHDRLMSCRCPIISISEPCKDFSQVCFDNSSAIKEFVHHFVNEHGFTRIGYMSGIKGHPDAVERLNAFGDAMEEHGLPREGAGVFHGDFWYNKQHEAAEFFIKKCGGLPQAIVCANDFMALSLCDALAKRGIRIPQDVCISGYDDVDEARAHIPSISTASQDKSRLADSIFSLFDKAISGKSIGRVTCIPTTNIYRGSCGCGDSDLNEPEDRNLSFRRNINLLYNIYDAEAAMLSLTGIDRIKDMEAVFEKHSLNFGRYTKFFLFAYTDEVGRPSYDSAFSEPTHTVTPAIWIDRTGTSKHMKIMSTDILIPPTDSPEPQCYYLTHLHFGEHCFGYSAVMMEGNYPFNEFYNIWTVNLAVAIETLMQRNSINALLCDLEKESTHDRLTGLLNRSGFEDKVHSVFN